MTHPFELIPAIDLLGGEAVRLSQGDYDQATVYDPDPANVATRFREAGIKRLHVVDLEGAKVGLAHVIGLASACGIHILESNSA